MKLAGADTVPKVVESRTSGVPAPAPHELRRERLLEVLHRHRARPLILLVAAAGFGKTTLAATYARDSGGAVAWLTLQPGDRDTRRLFTRLANALDAGFGEPGSVPALRRGLAEGAEGVGLARLLLDDLAQAPSGFIIVLDEFQLLGSDAEDANRSVDTLIRGLPEVGQIVIASREPPALSMTRLVVEGAVFPLGTEDLRLTADETRALRAKLGGDSSRDEKADGWVAGILLGGAPGRLGAAGASVLGIYVESEILARLTDDEQKWLASLSVFDNITPQIAERALGEGPWSTRLLALAERCFFLARRQDGSYGLHSFIRETAYNHLLRSPGDRARRAWAVARQLAEEASDPEGVVRACQELGQIDGAVAVVSRSAGEAAQTGRWQKALDTLRLLPEPVRRAQPELSLIEARALLNTGHPDLGRQAADAALKHGGRSGDVFVQISALVELATVTFASDLTAAEDWLAAADHILRHCNLPADQRHLLEGKTLGVRGICASSAGDIAGAREAFENGERVLSLLGPSRELALVQQNLGSFCNRIGEYAKAEAALASAAYHWRLMGDSIGRAVSQTVLGDLHLRLGNLDAAGAELNDALIAARSVGAVRMEAWAIESLGQWHRANGRIVEAVTAFDESIRLAEEIVERELLAEALVWRAEVALLQDDLPTARTLLARAQAEGQRAGSSTTLASVDRALGRMHLVDGAVTRAVNHFDAALQRAGDAWGPDQKAETLYWLGTAHLELDRPQKANSCLEEAISLARQANLPALLAGPAAEDPRLLHSGRKLGTSPLILGEVERLSATRRPWTGIRKPEGVIVVVQNELPRLEVQLFGSFLLHRDGELVNKASRKVDRARELAALLILNPKGLPDETIAEMMFPDMPRESAKHNLQMAVYSLKKDLDSSAAVRYSARAYQLNPQLEVLADVREFEAALATARGANGSQLVTSLSRAVELYKGPLLADAAWDWLEPVRLQYRSRYVSAAVQLADVLAPTDSARSDRLAEELLAVAPETDLAYERLIHNARLRRDGAALRRLQNRYFQAAAQFGFPVNTRLIYDGGTGARAAR
jgi:LuxR family maltose regulon positive regulatory protein